MNETKPLISIVMPAYNASAYLDECITSILSQTFADFELIIVDDGSEDNTIDIIKSYQDKRIRLLCNNHDFIKALNTGITYSCGKYIARMDADDIMLPERLEVQYEYLESNPGIDVSGTWIEAFGNREGIMKNAVDHHSLLLQSMMYTPVYHPSVIFRRKIIESFPYENNLYQFYSKDYIYAEDYHLWIELIKKGFRFGNIPSVLVKYRCTDTQVTSVRKKESMDTTFRIQNDYIEYVMEDIIGKDESFFGLLNSSIKLFNSGKLHFIQFRQIVYIIYSEILVLFG